LLGLWRRPAIQATFFPALMRFHSSCGDRWSKHHARRDMMAFQGLSGTSASFLVRISSPRQEK
jgi:hypothetical protein